MIYFIQNTRNGLVKIGFTNGDPKDRLSNLQVGSADPLKLLGSLPGDKTFEAMLHRRFKYLRRSGEWFTITEKVVRNTIESEERRSANPRPNPQMTLSFERPASVVPRKEMVLQFQILVDEGRRVG